jgi:hypothetical protein
MNLDDPPPPSTPAQPPLGELIASPVGPFPGSSSVLGWLLGHLWGLGPLKLLSSGPAPSRQGRLRARPASPVHSLTQLVRTVTACLRALCLLEIVRAHVMVPVRDNFRSLCVMINFPTLRPHFNPRPYIPCSQT